MRGALARGIAGNDDMGFFWISFCVFSDEVIRRCLLSLAERIQKGDS